MKDYSKVKKRFLRNQKTKKAYDNLGLEFDIAHIIIKARLREGLTQAELARRLATKQSAISRLENGTINPSVALLDKLAKALGTKLTISL